MPDPDTAARARQRDLVRRGYDAISLAYRDDTGAPARGSAERMSRYADWMAELAALLPVHATVLEPASLDAIVSLYALIHVPLADQRELLPRLRRWLRPGGYLLAIVGAERWTGVEDYLGATMFWDHEGTAAYLEWLAAAGLAVRWHRFIPEGTGGHALVLAQAV